MPEPVSAPATDAEQLRHVFRRRAKQTHTSVMTTDVIVAQVWRQPPEVGVARVLKALIVEAHFGDGKAIGALCAGQAQPDVVDASLAWWARRTNGRILSNDPDVVAYVDMLGVRVSAVPTQR